LIDRSVAADGSSWTGSVYLMRTSDPLRNVQWLSFETVQLSARSLAEAPTFLWLDANLLSGKTNVAGITSGRVSHSWLSSNQAAPGALAEHLTSYAGSLFDATAQVFGAGQMSLLDWIEAGYAGSYGTVIEPCAFPAKFPDPMYHYWYARGFSLGESFMMAVQNPYQGLLVGDPLCAPSARAPLVSIHAATNRMVVAGVMSLTGTVVAASDYRPVSKGAWYIDGYLAHTQEVAGPLPGNELNVLLNGTSITYTVVSNDTVPDMVRGWADAIQAASPSGVIASAHGDRLLLRQSSLGESASNLTVVYSAAVGLATGLAIRLHEPVPGFMETTMFAREQVLLSGNAVSGDVIRAVVTRLDGLTFTNQFVAPSNGTSRTAMLTGLETAILFNTNLQSSIGCRGRYVIDRFNGSAEMWLFARTNTWEGHNLFVQFSVIAASNSTLVGPDFSDNFNDNGDALGARSTLFLSAGVTQAMPVWAVDTTAWPDGPHELTLAVRDGTGVETEGRASVTVVVDNHDLSCTITSPADRVYRLREGVVTTSVSTAASMGSVTQIVVFAEGKVVATGATAIVALTNYGAGPLRLQAQAWDDLGRSTRSEIVTVLVYTDADSDGMGDQWEYAAFGALTNAAGTADADGDGVSNRDEFLAGSEPTNALSFLQVSLLDVTSLQVNTATDRVFRLRRNDGDLLDGASWYATGTYFRGSGLVTLDPGPATGDVRFLAIEAGLTE
jgi:hypothetical protein